MVGIVYLLRLPKKKVSPKVGCIKIYLTWMIMRNVIKILSQIGSSGSKDLGTQHVSTKSSMASKTIHFSLSHATDHEIKPFKRHIFSYTKYGIPKSLKVSHWLSRNVALRLDIFDVFFVLTIKLYVGPQHKIPQNGISEVSKLQRDFFGVSRGSVFRCVPVINPQI